MNLKLKRIYYSIPELQDRWGVSENDIRHEIANGNLVPSFFAQTGDFEHMVNWQRYDREQAESSGRLQEWEDKCGPTIEDVSRMHKEVSVGLNYLHGIGDQTAFDCTFGQFSSVRDIDPAEEPSLYLFPHDKPMTLARVIVEGVVTAEEVNRYEREKMQPAPGSEPASHQKSGRSITEKVWTDEYKEEVRKYREQHGLKKTAEHYNVSQALISRHVPAGKSGKKEKKFWPGLGG